MEFVLSAVAQHGCALQSATEELQRDRKVVLTAVCQNERALYFSADHLRSDKEFAEALASLAPGLELLQWAAPMIREDAVLRT